MDACRSSGVTGSTGVGVGAGADTGGAGGGNDSTTAGVCCAGTGGVAAAGAGTGFPECRCKNVIPPAASAVISRTIKTNFGFIFFEGRPGAEEPGAQLFSDDADPMQKYQAGYSENFGSGLNRVRHSRAVSLRIDIP